MQQAHITNWCYPREMAATITIWPLDDGAERYAKLRGRLGLTISCGAASVSLNPTAGEARALIAALQHAVDNPALPALAAAA